MESYDLFVSLGIALVAGLLIGLEREQAAIAEEKSDGSFIGGSRTFPLFALFGALSMLVSRQIGVFALMLAFVGVLTLVGVSYAAEVFRGGDKGLTSEVALLVTFLLGALSMTTGVIEPLQQKVIVVLAAAVVGTLLLSVKLPLHQFVAKATKEDVLATTKFLIVAVVVLPLLPNKGMGPFLALNPFKVGLMITLIGAVSFVGYVAMRVLGPGRGLTVTGLLGGLVSSTAVTLTFSRRAKEDPSLAPACALAIVLASTVMCARVVGLVAIVNRDMVWAVAFPMGAMTLASLASCALLYRSASRAAAREGSAEQAGARSHVELHNPFALGPAVKLGALFAVVIVVSKAASAYAGERAIYLTGLLAGTTDVDAITLSVVDMAKRGLSEKAAVTTILIAVASNTMVKGALAFLLGGWALGRRALGAFGVAIVGAICGMGWVWTR